MVFSQSHRKPHCQSSYPRDPSVLHRWWHWQRPTILILAQVPGSVEQRGPSSPNSATGLASKNALVNNFVLLFLCVCFKMIIVILNYPGGSMCSYLCTVGPLGTLRLRRKIQVRTSAYVRLQASVAKCESSQSPKCKRGDIRA